MTFNRANMLVGDMQINEYEDTNLLIILYNRVMFLIRVNHMYL